MNEWTEQASFSELELWLDQQAHPNDCNQHFRFCAQVYSLETDALRKAWSKVVNSYEGLRTLFKYEGDRLFRKSAAPEMAHLFVKHPTNSAHLSEVMDADFARSFDLSQETPSRISLYQLGDGKQFLQIVVHHIALDLTGYLRLPYALAEAYSDQIEGVAASDNMPQQKLTDIGKTQRDWLMSDQGKAARKYWEARLAGPLPSPGLPFQISDIGFSSEYKKGLRYLELSRDEISRANELARRNNCSLFSVFTAAVQLLTARYTLQQEIIVGIPCDERRGAAFADVNVPNGRCAVNTLPLITSLSTADSFNDLLSTIALDIKKLSMHRNYPVSALIKRISLGSLVASHKGSTDEFVLAFSMGLGNKAFTVRKVEYQSMGKGNLPVGRFDLVFALVEDRVSTGFAIHYNRHVYNEDQISSLGANLRHLLRMVSAADDVDLRHLNVSSRDEMELLQRGKKRSEIDLNGWTFLNALGTCARQHPHRPAVSYGSQALTFNELVNKSQALTAALNRCSLRGGDAVAFAIPRSSLLLMVLLSIIKAGAAFVPIDVHWPKEYVKYVLEDSGARVLITPSSCSAKFSGFPHCIRVDQYGVPVEVSTPRPAAAPPIQSDSNLAYIIYTSGSTGQPKGVEVSWPSLNNLLYGVQERLKLSRGDRWLALTTIGFDISLMELLLPLSSGAELVVGDAALALNPDVLAQFLSHEDITHFQATPSTWQALMDAGWTGNPRLTALSGGEPLSPSLAKRLLGSCRDLWNMYGPTETTIWSSMKRLDKAEGHVNIGRPIANTYFYVMNTSGAPVPMGGIGELCIGGAGVALGYHGNPNLSKDKFCRLTVFDESEETLFLTGDLAQALPNGEFECLGRRDRQIKIRGHRIDLLGLEEAIRQVQDVTNAAVTHVKVSEEISFLVAYYTGDCAEDCLREHLECTLPGYMRPKCIVRIEKFPMNKSGKIDYKSLPDPSGDETDKPRTPTRGRTESLLASIFAKHLRIDEVGAEDDFYSLGGNSLLIARTVASINKEFDSGMTIRDFMEGPTVRQIAQRLEKGCTKRPQHHREKSHSKRVVLSASQQMFWIAQRLNPGAQRKIPIVLEISGALCETSLAQALDGLVSRHEALRCTIHDDNGEVFQTFPEQGRDSLRVLDIAENCKDPDSLRDILTREMDFSFSFPEGPFYRFILIKCSKTHHLLLLVFHHVIFDALSEEVFLSELIQFYKDRLSRHPSSLASIPTPYTDFVVLQQDGADRFSSREQLGKWWKEYLRDAPTVLDIPVEAPLNHGEDNALLLNDSVPIGKELSSSLSRLARNVKTSLFAVLLSAYHILLKRYSNLSDIVIGVPVSMRTYPEYEQSVGCFVNMLPIRTRSSDAMSCLELLHATHASLTSALGRQELPLQKIVEKLNPPRSGKRHVLYQHVFNYVNAAPLKEIPGVSLTKHFLTSSASNLDIEFTVRESSIGLSLFVEWNPARFDKDFIDCLKTHYVNVLRDIANQPQKQVGAVEVVDNGGLLKQKLEQGEAGWDYDRKFDVLKAFADRVEQIPDHTALVCGEREYSYQEIDRISNQIANALIACGVESGDKVVMLFPRSALFPIAALGIWKTGAAYVPLNLNEGKSRLARILEEVQPRCALVDASNASKVEGLSHVLLENLCDFDETFQRLPRQARTVAYIIYTSGSSGTPKGVVIEDQSIADRVSWKCSALPLSIDETVLHTYSFAFDGSIINYLWPLCSGARLVIATDSELRDAQALAVLIRRFCVTTVDLLPSVLSVLLEGNELKACPSLQTVLTGGEALTRRLAQDFEHQSTAMLVNTYGPTEASIEATLWKVKRPYQGPAIVPIGRPIAGATLYVLDEQLRPLPQGIPGELCIGGQGLAKGYVDRKDLDQALFHEIDLQGEQDRVYRTGDLVRLRRDGVIEFLGRSNEGQVKIRGFRVELGEIEEVIAHLQHVREVAVLPFTRGDSVVLVGYVSLSKGASSSGFEEMALREITASLPDYMVPHRLVVIEELPRLPNGKVSRKKLKFPQLYASRRTKAYSSLQNETERQMHALWCDVLDLESLDARDHFFDLGGTSLLAMRLMMRIREQFKVSLPVASLLEHPSMRDLCRLLEPTSRPNMASSVVLLRKGSSWPPFFLVHPVGGGVLCYQCLAQQWPDNRPLYGIQAKGFDGEEAPTEQVEEMAKDYVRLIKSIQKNGPYHLGGWSFGGLVAVEMASLLEQNGESIGSVTIVDTNADFERFTQDDLDDNAALMTELSRRYLSSKTPTREQRFKDEDLVRFLDGSHHKDDLAKPSPINSVLSVARSNYRSLANYSIPRLKSPLNLLRACSHARDLPRDFGWNRFAPRVNVVDLPGDHWAITTKEHGSHYAEALSKCMEQESF